MPSVIHEPEPSVLANNLGTGTEGEAVAGTLVSDFPLKVPPLFCGHLLELLITASIAMGMV